MHPFKKDMMTANLIHQRDIPINYYNYSWTFSFWMRLETNSISCDGWDPSIFSARTSSSDLDFFHCCSTVCLFVNRADAFNMVAEVPAPLPDAGAVLWRLLNALIPLKPLMLALLLLLALLFAVASIVSHVSIIDALLFELMAAAKKLFATHAYVPTWLSRSTLFSLFVRDRSGMKYGRIRNDVSTIFRELLFVIYRRTRDNEDYVRFCSIEFEWEFHGRRCKPHTFVM